MTDDEATVTIVAGTEIGVVTALPLARSHARLHRSTTRGHLLACLHHEPHVWG